MRVLHWSGYVYFLYIFGYASLYKIFQKTTMMESMQSFGFNKTWTIMIGTGEVIGVVALLIGFWNHKVKNSAILFLFPFAVGALITHFAHQEYSHYYNALICCILSVFLLVTDKNFRIVI